MWVTCLPPSRITSLLEQISHSHIYKYPGKESLWKTNEEAIHFLMDYARGHIKVDFWELLPGFREHVSKTGLWPLEGLNCQELLFEMLMNANIILKALNLTTCFVIVCSNHKKKCLNKTSGHIATASVCCSQHIQGDGEYVLLGESGRSLTDSLTGIPHPLQYAAVLVILTTTAMVPKGGHVETHFTWHRTECQCLWGAS